MRLSVRSGCALLTQAIGYCVLCASLAIPASCHADQLDDGIAAFKGGEFVSAVSFFQAVLKHHDGRATYAHCWLGASLLQLSAA